MEKAKNPNAIRELVINNHMYLEMIDPSLSHSTEDNYLLRAKAQQGQENLNLAQRKPTTLFIH